ncbi:MAG: glycosyltransferase family 4 protein [Flavobacteriaceae bacterium]
MNRIKKKILLLHSSNDLYGASKIFLQITQILNNQGYEIHVVLPSKGPMDDFLENIINLNYHSLGVLRKKYLNPLGLINRILTNLKAIQFLSSYIKRNEINLVYTNTSTILAGGIAAKKNKIPSLFHIHEIPVGNKFYELFTGKMINKYSNRIIAVSNSVKNYWIKNVNENKIERIYNGIVFQKNEFFEKIKKNETDYVITTVSRLIPYKGHNYLIDIAEELLKKSNNFKFWIIGDTLKSYSNYERKLKNRVTHLGLNNRIKFLGFRDDVSNILEQSDLFIHTPILPDPLPTVLFESFHNDLPVIATNLGGNIEILENGNNGLLIPYNDSKKAASLILNYSKDINLQEKHLENSKNKFQSVFSPEFFKQNIIKEVNNLI